MKTLSQVKKSIPSECYEIRAFKSWFTLIRILAMVSLFIFIESKIQSLPLLIIVWFFHGQALVGLFVLGHDCGHNSFSKNAMTNLIVGQLCFSTLGNGFINWVRTHNHHHAHTQLRGQEVDWSKWLVTKEEFAHTTWKNNFALRLGYALPFGIFFWIWLNAISRGMQNSERAVKVSNFLMWGTMLSLYSSLWYFLGPWEMLKYHAIPATIAMFTGYFLLTIQHANEKSKWFEDSSWTPFRGQLEATFDVRFMRFFEWCWLDINLHVPHHVAPGIPWYHLRSARKSLLETHSELYQERHFSAKELTWMIKTPLIKYQEGEGIYTMRH